MTVSPFSRYSRNKITPIMDSNGITRATIIIEPPQQPVFYNVAVYTWQFGDQIDYLAHSAYGDETQWWRIADANPQILFWNNLTPGTSVRVPNA